MTSISLPSGEVKTAPRLEPMEQVTLCEWLPADEQNIENILERQAYWRNVERAAKSYGPNLIAMLMDAGALQPEQDPIEALKDLLRIAGF